MAGSHALEYEPFPSLNPGGAPGGDFQNIHASPDMFGAGVGKAIEGLGEAGVKASSTGFDLLSQQAGMDAKTHAAELHSWFTDQASKITEPFLEKRGRAAKAGLEDYQNGLKDLFEQAKSQSGNPATTQLLQSETRRVMDAYSTAGTRHAATQSASWEATTAQNNAASAGDFAMLAAKQNDIDKIHRSLFDSDQEIRNFLGSQGYDGPSLDMGVKRNRGQNVEKIVKQFTSDGSRTGLQRAIDFFHGQEEKIDPGSRATIETGLKSQMALYDGQTTADHYMRRGQNVPSGYIQRTFTLESGGNPNAKSGSYQGLGQFGPAAETRYGITDKNRNDPNAQAMALALENQDNYSALVKALGHDPTPADYYLAHQQGIGGAVSHLSQPNLPAWQNMASTLEGRTKGDGWAKQAIWGNMTPEMKAQFPGGVETVTSGDFSRMWAQRFNGQQIQAVGPGSDATPTARFAGAQDFGSQNKADVLAKIQNDPYLIDHPQAMQAAISHANKIFEVQSASYVDQERALKLKNEAAKAQSESIKDDLIAKMYSSNPAVSSSVTAEGIATMRGLLPEARENLIKQLEGVKKDNPLPAVSQATTLRLLDRIRKPWESPDKISDMAEVDRALQNHELNIQDYNFIRGQLKEDTRIIDATAKFLDTAIKPQIVQGDLGLSSPKANEVYYEYQQHLQEMIDQFKSEHKNPMLLFRPGSKDYMGRKEVVDDYVKRANEAAIDDTLTAKPFDINTVKSLPELSALYLKPNAPFTREQARAYAVSKGWVKPPVAQPAAPTVPQSR